MIEVEKDATQAVFFFLKEAKYSAIIDPTKDLIEKYLPEGNFYELFKFSFKFTAATITCCQIIDYD